MGSSQGLLASGELPAAKLRLSRYVGATGDFSYDRSFTGRAKMTGAEFNEIRRRAGLNLPQLAALLGLANERNLARFEMGEKEVSGPVAMLMRLLDQGRLAPEVESLLRGE